MNLRNEGGRQPRPSGLGAVLSLALRVMLGVWALLFMLGLMLLGLAVGGLVLLWALLRGRKPTLRFGRSMKADWGRFRRAAPAATPYEVVEVQAREIPGEPGGKTGRDTGV